MKRRIIIKQKGERDMIIEKSIPVGHVQKTRVSITPTKKQKLEKMNKKHKNRNQDYGYSDSYIFSQLK